MKEEFAMLEAAQAYSSLQREAIHQAPAHSQSTDACLAIATPMQIMEVKRTISTIVTSK